MMIMIVACVRRYLLVILIYISLMTSDKKPLCAVVGLQLGAANMENSMELPQKLKNRTATRPSDPFMGICPKKSKAII